MFSLCDPKKHFEGRFVQSLGLSHEYLEKLLAVGIRNSSLLSQQPNGNSSIYANIVSGGIEPIFMPEYIRTMILQVVPPEIANVTPRFNEGVMEETSLFKWVKEGDEDILRGVHEGTVYKIDRNRGLTKEILCEDYGVRELKARGEWDPKADYAVTTTELTVADHVNDLMGFARWTDSACSKTANIPNDYPYEDFKSLYLDVYKTEVIKGFTTYRSGTMTSVLSAKEEATADASEEEIILEDIKLPDSLPATLKTLRAEGRKWYITTIQNEAQTRPVALFVQTNAHEKSITANDATEKLLALARSKGIPEAHVASVEDKISGDNNASKICRTISLCLRHGVLIRNIVATLETVDCMVGTFVFHIRKFLAGFIKDGEKVKNEQCGECGSENVVYQEGCKVCANCGSSKCG
jgi:ribonucleoside-diphosphate reductase alpha chain